MWMERFYWSDCEGSSLVTTKAVEEYFTRTEKKKKTGDVIASMTFQLKRYDVNGGLDLKFEEEEEGFPPLLAGVVSVEDWMWRMQDLNERLRKHRHKRKDIACLAAGPLLLPLVPFMYRHMKHKKRRKALLKSVADEINTDFELRKKGFKMQWDRITENLIIKSLSPSTVPKVVDEPAAAAAAAAVVDEDMPPQQS